MIQNVITVSLLKTVPRYVNNNIKGKRFVFQTNIYGASSGGGCGGSKDGAAVPLYMS